MLKFIQIVWNVNKGCIFDPTNKNTNKMENLLSKSVEERAINFIINGVEPLEAVKLAIIEEQKLISEMLEQTTERSKKAKQQLCKNIYGLIHLFN